MVLKAKITKVASFHHADKFHGKRTASGVVSLTKQTLRQS
jgi:hypothetical protein